MWNKPWKFPEGFLLGAALIVVGLLLELSVGPVEWDAFAWPVNAIVLVALVVLVVAMHVLRKRVYAFRFASSYHAAIPALVYALVLTIVMGLTRQTADGTCLNNMLTFWPFVLVYTYIDITLGVVLLKQSAWLWAARHGANGTASQPRLGAGFLCSMLFHLGLFVTMTTATLGNADMQRLKMITTVGQPEWRALDQQGGIKEMPLTIELKKFIMETYDDGSPRRFASEVQILTKSGKNLLATIDVNKPVETDGWKIYQYGYDTQMGASSNISILELVSDPWLPAVYTGIYMMLAGAVLMFVTGGKRRGERS